MKQAMIDVVLDELSIDFREFVNDLAADPIEMGDLADMEVVISTLLRQVRNADLGDEKEIERVIRVLGAMKHPDLTKFQIYRELMETIVEVTRRNK